jgi:hypothetical protein
MAEDARLWTFSPICPHAVYLVASKHALIANFTEAEVKFRQTAMIVYYRSKERPQMEYEGKEYSSVENNRPSRTTPEWRSIQEQML